MINNPFNHTVVRHFSGRGICQHLTIVHKTAPFLSTFEPHSSVANRDVVSNTITKYKYKYKYPELKYKCKYKTLKYKYKYSAVKCKYKYKYLGFHFKYRSNIHECFTVILNK